MLKGIDVSKHDSTIDWKKVKDSGMVDFAILRAGVERETPIIPGKNEGFTSSPVTIILGFPKVTTGPA